MIDLHAHLLPAVDDGAAGVAETRSALRLMVEHGVTGVVATPHLRGGLTARPDDFSRYLEELDVAWAVARAEAESVPGLRVERGAEVMLDVPEPDLSDPRVRLAGTDFVLVEFPSMLVPPNAAAALGGIVRQGYRPVVAHPERYRNLTEGGVTAWRSSGAFLQVNCGSLLGAYGRAVMKSAWRLLEIGAADYLSSDYHARGLLYVSACTSQLELRDRDVARLLLEENARLLLLGARPTRVPPLTSPGRFWHRVGMNRAGRPSRLIPL